MRIIHSLSGFLADGFRLAFFRNVREERMAPTWGRILAAGLASLVVPVAYSLVKIGLGGQWAWYSLPFALFHLPLILGAAIAMAYAIRRPDEVPRFFYAGLLIAITLDLMFTLVYAVVLANAKGARFAWNTAFALAPPLWLALAFAAHACRQVDRGAGRLGAIAASLLLVALPLSTLYRDRSMWHPPYNASARGPMPGVAAEDAFYRQPQVLASELASLEPGRDGVIDVFFIGMAGYGGLDVFMREVDSVARLFRERFGAAGHTVRLVNNPRTVLEIPVASRTSLREALTKVASVMNKEEDVLVLFMTSHGTENHRFSLDLWPMRFHEIDPATLRALLDESGIRNRVVVISACYSGGFVDALRDEATLVITAAASDRSSFGCTSEATWTYFGRAYFDEALRQTHSFTEAFEIARPVIEAREKKEGFDPSRPQMVAGTAIIAKLAQLQKQLDGK